MNLLSVLLAVHPAVIYTIVIVLGCVVAAVVAYLVARNVYKRRHRRGEGKPVRKSDAEEIPTAEPAEDPAEPSPERAEEIAPLKEEREEALAEEAPVPVAAEESIGQPAQGAVAEQPEEAIPVSSTPLPPLEAPVPDNAKVVFAPANRLVSVRYDKSFLARLVQASEIDKNYYSQIKNELLRYRRVHARVSWRQESFRLGRELVAKLEIRGKTLCLYLALNPADYADSKYVVEDASDKKRNLPVPALYRIKNDRRAKYAIDLIADVFKTRETKYRESEHVAYENELPYRSTTALVEEGLVKIIEERAGARRFGEDDEDYGELEEESAEREDGVSAEEADREMRDDEAKKLVRESGNVSVRGKQTVVNVDTLGEYFNEGETVTLEDMRERIPFLNKSATYVKVLARGRLNKALIVEADDYSLPAVKMIVLAGGTVYRKRAE